MKKGWEVKGLAEVCKIVNGGTPKSKIKDYWGGVINWITPADLGKLNDVLVGETSRKITDLGLKKSSAKLFPENSVILSTRAPIGHLAINTVPMSTNQGCRGIVPNANLNTWFLFYFLKGNIKLLNQLGTGTTFLELSTKNLGSVEIPLPPLDEQKAIVAKLDYAFKAIDQAKANVQQNMANAEDLFQSQLNQIFSQTGEGWEEKKLGEVLKLKSGKNLTKKKMNSDGYYSVYGGNGFAGNHDNYNMDGEYVIIGRVGAQCGNVRYVSGKFWLTDNAFCVNMMNVDFDLKFLSILLRKINLRSYARQAAQPVISNSSIKSAVLSYPKEKNEQLRIVEIHEKSLNVKNSLKQKYQHKLESLEELKQSILEKAFKGELV